MSRDDGGPAFPCQQVRDLITAGAGGPPLRQVAMWSGGMSVRDYACIELRQAETGRPWLDDLIRKRQRDEFAGQSLRAVRTARPNGDPRDIAVVAYTDADVMLAERRKEAEAT